MAYYLKKSRRIVYRRKYNRSYNSNYGAKKRTYNQLLYNPFAKTNAPPKIADGREYLSAGIRLQAVKEIVCAPLSADDQATYFCIFPGISNALWILGASGADQAMPYNNHLTGTGNDQSAATKIAKWRMVSQGLRLQLLNNSDENEGWFEMIRYQMYPSSDGLAVQSIAMPPLAATGVMTIGGMDSNTLPGFDKANLPNFCEHPTYQSGKLRHLNRMIFKLYANTGDHEYIMLDGDVASDPGKLIDTSFDCMVFKIHGRTVDPAATNSQPTKLLAHVISNQEIVYDESSTLARYMTPNSGRRNMGSAFIGNSATSSRGA